MEAYHNESPKLELKSEEKVKCAIYNQYYSWSIYYFRGSAPKQSPAIYMILSI